MAKKYLNNLHLHLAESGYDELYVHQCTDDVVLVIRQNPKTLESYILVTRTAHYNSPDPISVNSLKLPGVLENVEFVATLNVKTSRFEENSQFINGLTGSLEISNNLGLFCNVTKDTAEGVDIMNFFKLPQAFVGVFKTKVNTVSLESVNHNYEYLSNFAECKGVFDGLTLPQINHILWRCSPEELDISAAKRDVYGVPGYHTFNYAGLGGLTAEFLPLAGLNRLSHEICNNLRQGNWMIDYTINRLKTYELPANFVKFISDHLEKIKSLPRSLIPKHFVKSVFLLFRNLKLFVLREIFKNSKLFATSDDGLVDNLGIAITQFWGNIPSAKTHMGDNSLSAGLPHFSVGFMRCWGRDTFIALKGLLLCSGLWNEAREIILTFASVMQYGLIPNLLDSGNSCRYNSRDATWFFMQAVKDYIILSPEGPAFLSTPVTLRFKNNEIDLSKSQTIPLSLLIHSIFQAHATGIQFREKNAGVKIDAHMRDEGFNIRVRLDTKTGFLHGGNRLNCGTWMDKMGSSQKAGNRGVPATPRDGAAIEITALLYSSLDFFAKLNESGNFPDDGVILIDNSKLLYEEWKNLIEENFENYYYIPVDGNSPTSNKKLIGMAGIYKDTLQSSLEHTDYQFRPNQCIAMAVAPKLFDQEHATTALNNITNHLMPYMGKGQIGIRTLNEEDKEYRPFYDNSNDSNDVSIAHGYSYHNGPEWVWPVGYYLRSLLIFNVKSPEYVMKSLSSYRKHIESSFWMSIPELTDSKGEENRFSSMAQAWSVSTLIEVLDHLR